MNKESEKKEIVFEKFLTRPYSIMHIQAYNQFLTEVAEEVGHQATYPVYVYNSSKNIVHLYYKIEELTLFIHKIGEKISNDNEFRKKTFIKFSEVFGSIKEYFDGNLSISTLNDLQSFFELFKDYMKYVAYTWILPGLDFVPQDIKDEAMKMRRETEFYAGKRDNIMKNSAASILGDPNIDPFFLTLQELEKSHQYLERMTKERSKGFLFYQGEVVPYDKISDFLKIKNFVLKDPENNNSSEIKGSTAQKGIVKGIARIVYTEKDLKKISSSKDILVSPMTRPEFVPAMKIAGAIVTDEGGIICHASIVARELRKPCIIGTKIATQVLKDGDMVEVDADKGVVRIIK